jgi:hypothetical protein
MFGDMKEFETMEILWFQVACLRSGDDTIIRYFR